MYCSSFIRNPLSQGTYNSIAASRDIQQMFQPNLMVDYLTSANINHLQQYGSSSNGPSIRKGSFVMLQPCINQTTYNSDDSFKDF